MNDNIKVGICGCKHKCSPLTTYKTIILKPNCVCSHNTLTQDMLSDSNIKYVIKYDFTLGGEQVIVPNNCIIEFDGGSLRNGTIVGQDTLVINVGDVDIWGYNITREGTWREKQGKDGIPDKEYDPEHYSGLGRKTLELKGDSNILTQEDFDQDNTIYVILYDFDLNDADIHIPEGCILEFEGGSLKNGTVIGNNASINNPTYNIFNNCVVKNLNVSYVDLRWFGAVSGSNEDSALYFRRCLDNFIQYNLGCYIYVVGEYTIKSNIETSLDLNIVGESYPSRILIPTTENNLTVDRNPASIIRVASNITAFTLNGLGYQRTDGWIKATHLNLSNLYIYGTDKTTTFVECHTIGAPSRPGQIKACEIEMFDKVLYFAGDSTDTTLNTAYYNLTIGDNCNIYYNNYVVDASSERITLGGLCLINSVIEQNEVLINIPNPSGEFYQTGAFGASVFQNCLFEGSRNDINFKIWRGSLKIDSCYFENNSGHINISGSAPGSPIPSRIKMENNYCESVNSLITTISYTDIEGVDCDLINERLFIDGCTIHHLENMDVLAVNQLKTSKRGTKLPYIQVFEKEHYFVPVGYENYFDKDTSEIYNNKVSYQGYEIETKLIPSTYNQLNLKAVQKTVEVGDYIIATFYKTYGKCVIGMYGDNSPFGMTPTEGCEEEGMYVVCVKAEEVTTKKFYILGRYTENPVYISRITMSVVPASNVSSTKILDVARILDNFKNPSIEMFITGEKYNKLESFKFNNICSPIQNELVNIYYDNRGNSVFDSIDSYQALNIHTMTLPSVNTKITQSIAITANEGDCIIATFYKTSGKCILGVFKNDNGIYSTEGFEHEGVYSIVVKIDSNTAGSGQFSVWGRYTGEQAVNVSRVTFIKVDSSYVRNYLTENIVCNYSEVVFNSGTFAEKPNSAANNIPVGFRYFCTDKQTTEGATNGIEIIFKGQDVIDPNNPVDIWVDALGRIVQ